MICHYGSNFHRGSSIKDIPYFRTADTSEHRARKISKKPSLLGYSTRGDDKTKREQEEKWIDLSNKDKEN